MPDRNMNIDASKLKPKGYHLPNLISLAERIKQDLASGKIKLEKVNMSVYGVEQLTELLIFLAKFASITKDAVDDDGKITLGDATKFVELIFPLINAITGIQEVPKELADLDPIEKNEIIAAVKASLDLYENDELAVETGLRVIFELVGFLKIVGVIKPAEPVPPTV